MKKLIAIALFVGFSALNISCSKQVTAQTQPTIESFVKTYFPDVEILSSIKDGLDYDVTLSDYTKIEFDGNLLGGKLEWDEIDCKNSTVYKTVPSTLIPSEISTHVAKYHSDYTIVKISKDRRGWEIELSNGIEIEFDRKFNVIEIDYKK